MVHKRTSKGAYVLKELDGTNIRHGYAGFRLVPYIARDRTALHQIGKNRLENEIEELDIQQMAENPRQDPQDEWTDSENSDEG